MEPDTECWGLRDCPPSTAERTKKNFVAFDARDIRPRLFLVLANRLYKSRLVLYCMLDGSPIIIFHQGCIVAIQFTTLYINELIK